MTAFWLVFGISGWVVAIVFGASAARARRRMLQQALSLRTHVRPYLQRRAFETSLDVPEAPAANVDAIVQDLCRLADSLAGHERGSAATADTVNMLAVSDTQPMKSEQDVEAHPNK